MMFESPPFIDCPNCQQELFGVLSIHAASYERRCAGCGYPRGTGKSATYWLPELRKRLIYLDQSVLSNFMKALNPRAGRTQRIDPKWKALFGRLDVLVKMQVVVCPDSDVHRAESIVYEYGEDVKRVYELLSHGISFHESNRIWFNQHKALFNAFIDGRPVMSVQHELQDAIPDSVHAWQEKILLTVSLPTGSSWIEPYKEQKRRNHDRLSSLFKMWQTPPRRDFDHWFRIEMADANDIAKERFGVSLFALAKGKLRNEVEAREAVARYFDSEFPTMAILSRIDCALFAILAHKANHGMKRLKDEGVMNDFKTLSITLPYCDAIVVDNQTAGLLREVPGDILKFRARVFSLAEIEKFGRYLDEIRSEVADEHLAKVREVYGQDFPRPYFTVFENE